MEDEVAIVEGIVEATTTKHGGGIKVNGKWYNLKDEKTPKKGEYVMLKVSGKNIREWRAIKIPEPESIQDAGTECVANGTGIEKRLTLPGDLEVPVEVKGSVDLFLAIMKYLKERVSGIDNKNLIIISSVMYKELMESKRAMMYKNKPS